MALFFNGLLGGLQRGMSESNECFEPNIFVWLGTGWRLRHGFDSATVRSHGTHSCKSSIRTSRLIVSCPEKEMMTLELEFVFMPAK